MRGLFYVASLALFALPARAASLALTIEQFGLMGTWATDCAADPSKARSAFRIIVAEPPGGAPTYTTVNVDDGIKTTIHSLVQAVTPLGPGRLTLRVRIFGGDVNGGPLPSMFTNTTEQTFAMLANNRMQMAGPPPISFERCPDQPR